MFRTGLNEEVFTVENDTQSAVFRELADLLDVGIIQYVHTISIAEVEDGGFELVAVGETSDERKGVMFAD